MHSGTQEEADVDRWGPNVNAALGCSRQSKIPPNWWFTQSPRSIS